MRSFMLISHGQGEFFKLFHYFHVFCFTLTASSSFTPPKCLFVLLTATLCPSTYPSAASRSLFLIDFQLFFTAARIVRHFVVMLCSKSPRIPASSNFYVFLLSFMWMDFTGFPDTIKSQTSNVCWVMHS